MIFPDSPTLRSTTRTRGVLVGYGGGVAAAGEDRPDSVNRANNEKRRLMVISLLALSWILPVSYRFFRFLQICKYRVTPHFSPSTCCGTVW